MSKLKKLPNAWVVSSRDKGRKQIINNNVYLSDGEYFEIELYNPLNKSVSASIKLNGSLISKRRVVIRPGERIYLDCFIDDKRKFLFETYNVDNDIDTLKSISDNGSLEVIFYKESETYINITPYNNTNINISNIPHNTHYNTVNYKWEPINTTLLSSNVVTDSIAYNSLSNVSYSSETGVVETGTVVKGEISNQDFKNVYEYYDTLPCNKVNIKILPESRKPLTKKDINNINKSTQLSILEDIKELHNIYEKGIITESEYNECKAKLLARI